jgi:hypothetical protein
VVFIPKYRRKAIFGQIRRELGEVLRRLARQKVIPGQRSKDKAHRQRRRKQLRQRSVIEALIGHMKTDGLLGRNWLKSSAGDAVYVVLCAAGQNLRLILKTIAAFSARFLVGLRRHPQAEEPPQRSRVWFTKLSDIAAIRQLAGSRRFGFVNRTRLAA